MFKTCKKPPMSIISASGSICTFNALQEGLPLKSHTIALTATQSGSGTPSPSNPRPISGYSAINIGVVGKNWLNNPDQTTTGGSYIINNVNVPMVAGYYVLSFEFSGTRNSSSLRIDDENGTAIFTTSKTITNGHNEFLLNLPSNGSFVKLFSNAVGTYSNFQIELGNQFTTYEPYIGNTYTTITIGSTIYGGNYDARTGVLTVTHKSVVFDGSEQGWTLNQVQSNNAVYITISDKKAGWQTSICDKMQNVNGCWGNSTNMGLFCDHPSLKRLYFNRPDNSLSLFFTVEDWKTWLSNNNVRVCYELENPQTIQLPPCPIDTLQGVNNIFADCGSTALEAIKIGR